MTTTTTIQSLIDLDFLVMSDKDILAQNAGKKFDVCLMNPPYATTDNKTLHMDFVEKCINISNEIITIMPSSFIKKDIKHFKKYQNSWNNYLYKIEEVDSNIFGDTNMQNIAIYQLNNKKHDKLIINFLNKTEEIEGGIINKDYSGFSNYEKEIVKYLFNENINFNKFHIGMEEYHKYTERRINKLNDGIYLLTNITNGSSKGPWNPSFISSKLGQIFDNKEDLKKCMLERKGARCNIMIFNSKKAAENCKIALQNPLLRFILLRTQADQGLVDRNYKYIPDIDWSNPKTKTDEGLLELCGCPKDKAKEYAEYCKKIIEEVDKK